MPQHTHAQRATFLQYLLHSGCVKEAAALAQYRELVSGGDPGLGLLLHDINKGLAFADLEIRRRHIPAENAVFVSLVNTREDDLSKAHGTPRNPGQLHYLKAVMKRIALEEGCEEPGVPWIESNAALNCNAPAEPDKQNPKPPTLREREKLLEELVEEKWLSSLPGSRLSIGPRAFLELGPFLLSLDLPDATRIAWLKFL